MAKEHNEDLLGFLSAFPDNVSDLALWLRNFVWDAYPTANELIYDNYNALAFGWSPTDKVGHTFCSIAVGRTAKHNVHFGFYWGSKIPDPEKKLLGKGNQYRYILVKNKEDFPKQYMAQLMQEAYSHSMSIVKDPTDLMEGKTITKSISANKRDFPL